MSYFSKQIKNTNYRIQFYYPTINIKSGIFLEFNNVIRLCVTKKYTCFAICLFGFGVGFDNNLKEINTFKKEKINSIG